MKRLIIFACFLGLASIGCAVPQYRDFRDNQGRLIRARVLKYDSRMEMVTIERYDKRTAKMPLNKFCDADQAYIRNHGSPAAKKDKPAEASTPTTKPLSRKEVEAIGERYFQALKDEDATAARNLFHESTRRRVRYSNHDNWKARMKTLDLGRVEGNNIYVVLGGANAGYLGTSGWIQLTPDGKIKYCPLSAPHPVEDACRWARAVFMNIDRIERDKSHGIRRIEETGIPTFGLSTEMSKSEMRDAIDEIKDWLIENGGEFDNSDPRVFLPEKQMKVVKRTLKSF